MRCHCVIPCIPPAHHKWHDVHALHVLVLRSDWVGHHVICESLWIHWVVKRVVKHCGVALLDVLAKLIPWAITIRVTSARVFRMPRPLCHKLYISRDHDINTMIILSDKITLQHNDHPVNTMIILSTQ